MKECPFCGDANLNVNINEDDGLYNVHCSCCGAKGPSRHVSISAIVAWDVRYDEL